MILLRKNKQTKTVSNKGFHLKERLKNINNGRRIHK